MWEEDGAKAPDFGLKHSVSFQLQTNDPRARVLEQQGEASYGVGGWCGDAPLRSD